MYHELAPLKLKLRSLCHLWKTNDLENSKSFSNLRHMKIFALGDVKLRLGVPSELLIT